MYYQTYDITDEITLGDNELTMYVADGWYFSTQAGPVVKEKHKEPSVLFQVELEYFDGTKDIIASDGSEKCGTDFIVYSDLYQGEKQDYTKKPGKQETVIVREYGYSHLCAQPMNPIIPAKIIPAKNVFTTPAGETIVDFGQVLAGKAQIHLNVPKGEVVTFEYFEILDENGNYINTMFAPQKDTVVSDGTPIEHEAWFTFHGFRYIKVTGMKNIKCGNFKAVLLTTKKKNTGNFWCSDERLNRLYDNIRWSQYNNMMSVPSDCPTREKAGWTGDILIYAKTALMNEEMTPFLKSWLNNVRADQDENGVVKIVAPYMKLYENIFLQAAASFGDHEVTGVAGWSDAIVWIPYDMYMITGDQSVLKENFEAMEKWTRYIITTAREKRGYKDIPEEYDRFLWNTGFHFGEWLIPSRPDNTGEQYGICKESSYYIAPFFGYKTVQKMGEICNILGYKEKAKEYIDCATKMKWAIQKGIFEGEHMPKHLMGAYIIAFAFDLIPDNFKNEYKATLLNLIHNNDDCLDTGFLATPYILDVLYDLGEKELAYKLFWQNKMPSWFYEVDNGATTIWEAWDADEAKTTGRYVSFDHYAFGCVDNFICRHIAGIYSDTPGFSHVIIQPDVIEKLTSCRRVFISEAGQILVEWTKENLKVIIPTNTTATVYWKNNCYDIGSGKYVF